MLALREMTSADIDASIRIIDSHDEDDAEEAKGFYERYGVANQYTLTLDDTPIGVTGIKQVDGCDKTYWLSWTYIDDEHCGNGYGRKMLKDILDELANRNARKVFLKVSDYIDPEDGDIYGAARHLYQAMGFSTEITLADFYEKGETQFIMGLRLEQSSDTSELDLNLPDIIDVTAPVKFNNLFEIAETEGSFCFGWEVSGKQHFTPIDVQIGLDAAKEQGARSAYVTFPSNFSAVSGPLEIAKFQLAGTLNDYYEDGIHEWHFVHHIQ